MSSETIKIERQDMDDYFDNFDSFIDKQLTAKQSTAKQSTDNQLTDNQSTNKRSTDEQTINKQLNDKQSTDKQTTDKQSTNSINQSVYNEFDQTNLNDLNIGSSIDLIDNNLLFNLDDSTKWILGLDWEIKNQLICLLDKFTKSLLFGHDKANDDELIEEKDYLIKTLTKLPFNQEFCSNKLILKIDNKFRYIIIDHLIKNEYIAIKYEETIGDYKSKLIKENNDLITKLTYLPIETVDNNNLNNKKRKIDHILKDKSEIQDYDYLKNNINNLKKEVIELKKQFDDERSENKKFKIEYNSKLNESNKQTNLSIKLKSVKRSIKEFFESEKIFLSESFNYLNLEWSILLKSMLNSADKKKYLELYLNVRNILENKNFKWQCKLSYELIIKTNLPDKPDKISKSDYVFSESMARGWNKFITEQELFDPKNGFIKDDTIYLEANLNIQQIIRYI